MLPITAGAADVDRSSRAGDPFHPGAHRPDCAGNFLRSFAAVGEFDQSGGDGFIRHFAIEHLPE